MKYNIYTVIDNAYIDFGKIFINSLNENVNQNHINQIIIVDNGLNEENKNYLNNKNKKVKLIQSGENCNFNGGSWGPDWHKNIAQKTKFLYHTVNHYGCPTIMVDIDCMFMKDINNFINTQFDVQLCHRKKNQTEQDENPYLASFVIINNQEKGLDFVKKWIDNREKTPNKKYHKKQNGHQLIYPKETPALCKTAEEVKKHISIGKLPIQLVSATPDKNVTFSNDASVIHFKSKGRQDNIADAFKHRVHDRGYKEKVKKYLD